MFSIFLSQKLHAKKVPFYTNEPIIRLLQSSHCLQLHHLRFGLSLCQGRLLSASKPVLLAPSSTEWQAKYFSLSLLFPSLNTLLLSDSVFWFCPVCRIRAIHATGTWVAVIWSLPHYMSPLKCHSRRQFSIKSSRCRTGKGLPDPQVESCICRLLMVWH